MTTDNAGRVPLRMGKCACGRMPEIDRMRLAFVVRCECQLGISAAGKTAHMAVRSWNCKVRLNVGRVNR